jgi:3-oxoacyl-[acyl-carrier-protein] synthase II
MRDDNWRHSSSRRVVVTGLGILCPIGNTIDEAWDSLMTGRSGTAPITRFDPEGFGSRIAGEVRGFDPKQRLGAKDARRVDRYIQLAVAATQDALASSELRITQRNERRIGVLIGTALGGIETAEREIGTLKSRGPNRVSPFFIPMFLADMAPGYVSIVTGAKGPNLATLSACASGAHAIGEAAEMIRRGGADVMIAGGAEAPVTSGSVAGFHAMGALSTLNDEAETASRPFDATRDGFVVAEGAAILILESLDHARARGANVLGEVTGYGMSGDACHITQPAPDGEGAARAMTEAVSCAGLGPSAVDYINAHGTSTPLNDRLETVAIKQAFGDHQHIPPVTSTKALTGHLLGAGGAIEAVFCLLALQRQIIPPTWHLRNLDPDCDLDYVTGGPRPAELRHTLSNSLGFGGHNVALVLSRYSQED